MRFSILHLPSSILAFLLLAVPVRAHDPLGDLPAPVSVQEAWDVINQSVRNMGRCIETNQFQTLVTHVANCSPALRVLQADAKKRGDAELEKKLEALFKRGDALIIASREKEDPAIKAQVSWENYDAAVTKLTESYPPAIVKGGLYVCVHHPLDRSTDPKIPCTKCGMKLIRRRIPSSLTYEKPGAPSMKLETKLAGGPLKVGQKAEIMAKLTWVKDGSPVVRKDLLVMHTERIHLLIVDSTLRDYHHEHPKPTDTPGEYVFSFTPNRPGAYRIFADVVPAETSLQEYVIGEIPADTQGGPVEKGPVNSIAEADGFNFEMALRTRDGKPPRANQVVTGMLMVKAPDMTGFKKLEPVMGAFAHLVAFHEDGKTVLHIHPEGPEPQRPEERGGPILTFKFYAPVPGYYRLYAQTQIYEGQVFAPFNLVVEK